MNKYKKIKNIYVILIYFQIKNILYYHKLLNITMIKLDVDRSSTYPKA